MKTLAPKPPSKTDSPTLLAKTFTILLLSLSLFSKIIKSLSNSMTKHCHLCSSHIAHWSAISISHFCSKSDSNVSKSSALRLVSLFPKLVGLSLSHKLMSLSQRSMLHSLFRSNQCLSFSGSLSWWVSFFLPCPSMVVVIGGCGSGGQLGSVMSHGVGCGRVVESHSYIPSQASMAVFRASIG